MITVSNCYKYIPVFVKLIWGWICLSFVQTNLVTACHLNNVLPSGKAGKIFRFNNRELKKGEEIKTRQETNLTFENPTQSSKEISEHTGTHHQKILIKSLQKANNILEVKRVWIKHKMPVRTSQIIRFSDVVEECSILLEPDQKTRLMPDFFEFKWLFIKQKMSRHNSRI